MAFRVLRSVLFLVFLVFFLVAISCKNEPYKNPTMGVSALRGSNPSSNRTFHYKSGKVDAFTYSSGNTSVSGKVYYSGDRISHLTADSTATSRKVSKFYYDGLNHTDTLKLIDTSVRVLQIRKVIYDAVGQPVSVSITTFGSTETTYRRADLTWNEGNVTRLVVMDPTLIENNVLSDITITHVLDKPGMFESGTNQWLALGPEDLYLLSRKNPESIISNTATTDILYWYNKLDYPSAFQIGTTTYNVGYVQMFE